MTTNKAGKRLYFRYVALLLSIFSFSIILFYFGENSGKFNFYGSIADNDDDKNIPFKNLHRLTDQFQFRQMYDNGEYNGLPFDNSWNKFLQKFGLLNVGEIDDAHVLSSEPFHVTAFSDNHYQEAKSTLAYLSKQYGTTKILYLYDIGLSEDNKKEIRHNFSNIIVEMRKFPFDDYPQYVRLLDAFRWKPLIIAQMLSEHPSIWWMDTSAKLKRPIKNMYLDFKNCSAQNLTSCPYYPWITVDDGGHSIFAATVPSMFKYLPMPESLSKNLTMVGANLQLIYGIKHVKENVLRFWVLCALQEDCMAPQDARLNCYFKDRYKDYARCHRFDQSAMTILLTWVNDFKDKRYRHKADNAFEIERF